MHISSDRMDILHALQGHQSLSTQQPVNLARRVLPTSGTGKHRYTSDPPVRQYDIRLESALANRADRQPYTFLRRLGHHSQRLGAFRRNLRRTQDHSQRPSGVVLHKMVFAVPRVCHIRPVRRDWGCSRFVSESPVWSRETARFDIYLAAAAGVFGFGHDGLRLASSRDNT